MNAQGLGQRRTVYRSIIAVLLMASVLQWGSWGTQGATLSVPTVVVQITGRGVDPQLYTAMQDLWYFNWVIVEDLLNASVLSEARMLLLMRTDGPTNYTTSELDAVANWFSQGGKTIWVGGHDCGWEALSLHVINSPLERIGSSLRVESCFVNDETSYVGWPHTVLGVSKNCDKEFSFLISGVNKTLFQACGTVIGYRNQTYFSLEWPKPQNIYRIMTTTENGVVQMCPPIRPEVHPAGSKGSFVLLAIETDSKRGNNIIVSAERPFSNRATGMYKPEIYEEYQSIKDTQQGALLFENLIKLGINPRPVARANGPYTGEEGKSISFTSSGSTDQDGTITAYKWDFGDGTGYGTTADCNHTYAKPGIYEVTLTVTDDYGGTGSQTTQCTITAKQATDGGLASFPIERIATLLTIGGAVVGVAGWIFRSRGEKKRKQVLFTGLLEGIDSIYTRFKMNARNCEAELYKMKLQILNEYKQGMLDQEKYSVLNQRIDDYMEEVQKQISKEEA